MGKNGPKETTAHLKRRKTNTKKGKGSKMPGKKEDWHCWVCVIFSARIAIGKHVTFFSLFFMFPCFSCQLLGGFSARGFLLIVFYFRLWNYGWLIQVIGLGFFMPLAPICILNCKQCMVWMNIEYVGFPDLGFQGKNICEMCVFSIAFFLLF